jgi:PAS domain S-box-containing protein
MSGRDATPAAITAGELAELRLRLKALERLESERSRVEALLRASEERLRILAESATDWVLWLSPEGRVRYSSPSCEALTGWPAEAFERDPELLSRCIHPEDLAAWQAVLAAEPGEHAADEDLRLTDRQGRARWLSVRFAAVRGTGGENLGLRLALRDVTKRKEAERARNEAEAQYRSIFDNAPVGIFRATPEGRYLSVNPAMAALYGYPSPAAMVERVKDFRREVFRDPARCQALLAQVAAEGMVGDFEAEVVRADGSPFWTARSIRGVFDASGRLTALDGFVLDVSRKKELEALREDVERMVRHDMKNPILGIMSGAELLLKRPLEPEARRFLSLMQGHAMKALRLAGASLDYYRMERGEYRPAPAPFDLLDSLALVLAEQGHLAEARGVAVRLTLDGREPEELEVCPACGEVHHLETMFANLVQNALEAAPRGSAVTVAVTQGEPLTVTVHNRGAVPADVRERFFERYATSGKAFGTGLGTTIARLIARAHGGEVKLSTSESAGTTLTVTLPAGSCGQACA